MNTFTTNCDISQSQSANQNVTNCDISQSQSANQNVTFISVISVSKSCLQLSKNLFGGENPFASRSTEKDAADTEFEDGPIPASKTTPNE